MSKNQVMEMSKVIGQIEDELRDIKSAKEQAEAVIGSNKALSDSLQALFDSANNVAKVLESNAQQVIADTTNKLEMLNIQAYDIDKYAQQGVSKISEQYALAQSKLEDELGNLAQKLMGTISASTNQSLEVVGNELAGYRVLVHEVAKKFTDSTSDAITKQEGQIAVIDNLAACIQERQSSLDSKIKELRQLDIVHLFDEINEIRRIETENATAIKEWKNELAGYRVLVHEATKKFTDFASDAITKQEVQIDEISNLATSIQERQYALDSKLEEIRKEDIVRLFDEISEIRRIETENATAIKKWRVVELSSFGVCIVLGVAILIRLLVM